MSKSRRATVYLEPEVHRALRLKAASTERSISELVNTAVKEALADDAEDLEDFRERRREESLDFEEFVTALKRRGRL